ncbi:MAG: LPS-assembly protein LptD, partial [Spirochaetaceae bacterium]|nr:LPS-assembly protein LptD [Spirochaetaceae bacterium]
MDKFRKLRWVISSLFLLISATIFAQNAEEKKQVPTVITVERAEKTESRKDPETGNSLIIFEGGVLLTVEREDTEISISAQLVQFDRERQQLFASGDITFNQKKGGEEEVLTADNLLLNVKTLDGFFDETRISQEKSEAINIGSDSVMVVFADITGRDESGTIAFKNADLTFCDEPDPHWKIKASRIWLLPGNEFAFFNALVFVGPIPVAYLPFFYYPKDEMILNPVFGSREREGYFIQTTTYLLGRKPLSQAEDEESLFNFIQPTELKEQKLEGLFLRNLDEPYKGKSNHTLKLMADYYTALGFMVGLDGKFNFSKGIVKELTFDAYLGFSRNLYSNPLYDGINFKSRYVPYNPDLPVEEQKPEWNKSNLFGLEL